MAFVIHPLTQQNSEPKYTASDFRLTVSNFLVPGTGERFGAVQGVRWDDTAPIVSMSGSTITVRPHSGIIAPWTGVGAYAYAITSNITVQRPTTGDYYVVLTVEDPSQSHGSEPQGRVDLMPVSTPRASILGLVIGKTIGSDFNDTATRLRNSTVIEAVNKNELDLIKPARYTRARARFGAGNGEYEYNGSKWEPVTQPQYEAVFKMQGSNSFNPYNGWSTPRIHVRGGYIDIDLNGFKSTVGVGAWPVWQYLSGVKPSAAIQLGVIGFMRNSDYAKTGVWQPSGAVDIVSGVANGDSFVALPRRIPVPDGVTFS